MSDTLDQPMRKLTDYANQTNQELIERRRSFPDRDGHGLQVVLEEDSRDSLAMVKCAGRLCHGVLLVSG